MSAIPAGMPSVLARATPADVRMAPFAHIVVENCLPPELYRRLADAYPADAVVRDNVDAHRRKRPAQNQRNDIGAHRSLSAGGPVAPLWQDFVRRHTSPVFLAELMAVFAPAIRATHPWLEARLGQSLESLDSGVRFDPAGRGAAVALDCQIGINTPVTRMSRVRGLHVDAPEELFAMLLYFRREDDASAGGDLELYAWKPGRKRRFDKSKVDPADVDRVATIPYRANTLVAFVNSVHAVHAVSPRSPTPHSRRLVNLIGEVGDSVPEGLFELPQRSPLARIGAWIAGTREPARPSTGWPA